VSEEWRFVPGTGEWYEVSNLGRVRTYHLLGSKIGTRSAVPRVLDTYLSRGYPKVAVQFDGKQRMGYGVHQLAALAFIGPRDSDKQVCHNDGNPSNNNLSNLRYDTYSGNQMDRLAHGTDNRGAKHGMAKLTEDAVREIRRLCELPDRNYDAISRQFNLARGYARQIHIGKVWGWLA